MTTQAIRDAVTSGDIPGAVKLALVAFARKDFDPLVMNLVAFDRETAGDFEGALQLLRSAAGISPGDASIPASIGHCLIKLARPREALESFNLALRMTPRAARAHHGAGLALAALGQRVAGMQAQERAHRIDPQYPAPIGSLALFAFEAKDYATAGKLADQALALDPKEGAAVLVKAGLLIGEGSIESGAAMLAEYLEASDQAPLQRSGLLRVLADGYDTLGLYEKAFNAYAEANLLAREIYLKFFSDPKVETVTQMCERLSSEVRRLEPADGPGSGPPLAPTRTHAFLIGFPRSGTTLLEHILATHPRIATLGEKPTLNEAIKKYFIDSKSLDDLNKASEQELDFFRRRYWRTVESLEPTIFEGCVIDKQPMLLLYLPLLKRLFPDAKIIHCVRDPRDVIASCFRRGFSLNRTTVEFTTLETLSALFSAANALMNDYRSHLQLALFEHKHERVIHDFEFEVRKVCEFLSLPFDPLMWDFAREAEEREITTPSAEQVRAGLNDSGIGTWLHYEKQLKPFLPALAPAMETYGY